MSELPTGTVTFLYTDIEGSTVLAQQFPAELPALLARHHAILHQAIQAHNGHVFQITGDAFCAAFHTASDALKAALDAQRGLQQEAWNPAPIRVRMGIHAGSAQAGAIEERAGGYVGYLTLTRVQRVMSAAHGGQVLLSNPTAELVRGELRDDVTLRDMGEHRLKGLLNPEHLWQLVAPDVRQDFPPLQSLNAIPNNLPIQLTSFIGREKEIAEVKQLLSASRLVTLSGAGGAGKTRLSLQVAAEVIDAFENGIWFIDLAPLSDATSVTNTAVSTLGLRDEAGRTAREVLVDYLHAQKVLLILDNCEHLIEACAELAHHLLTHCPQVRIVATSREALDIAGETQYHVPSLSLPDPQHLPVLEALSQYEAVHLFIERATTVQSHFAMTNSNAPAVAQICYRLDGIPLAIELAAARIKLFSPEQIAERLDDRFRLLTGGSRTTIPRQQTLRAAIEWSHSLLSEAERILFRRLAVFAGGWTFEAAEQVCAGDGLDAVDVLDALSHLVDKSLVTTVTREGETRYRMLETIREYAFVKLREAGENNQLREHHLDFYLKLANETNTCTPSEEPALFDRLEREHDNLRAALNWALEQNASEHALELCATLSGFWETRGYWTESGHWFGQALTMSRQSQTHAPVSQKHRGSFARVLLEEGHRALQQGDYPLADARLHESLGIYQELGDKSGVGDDFFSLGGLAWYQGDAAAAQSYFEADLEIGRELDDQLRIPHALWILGMLARERGDYPHARALGEESLARYRELDDKAFIGGNLQNLGCVAILEHDFDKARALFEESAEFYQPSGGKLGFAMLNETKGFLAWYQGEYVAARSFFKESLDLNKMLRANGFLISPSLAGVAAVDVAEGQLERATKLLSAIRAENDRTGRRFTDICLDVYDKTLAAARSQLGEQTFAKSWAEGYVLTMEQAIALALNDE